MTGVTRMILFGALSLFSVLVIFIGMSFWSSFVSTPDVGLKNGKLKPCPESPNCVCSEFVDDENHYIDSIILSDSTEEAIKKAVEVILSMDGEVINGSDDYVHAVFTTPILRFKDDFELRFGDGSLFLKSSSRVGYSDLGTNRKRILAFQRKFSDLDS